jgi:alanine racemase
MAVVEANAYGHGVTQIATAALDSGAMMLGVGSLREGLELRRRGIEAPILILGHVLPQGMRQAVAHDLTVSLHDAEGMRALAQAARSLGRVAKVHLCVDTGGEGVGVAWKQVASLARELVRLEVLEMEGLYTPLALSGATDLARYGRERLAIFAAIYNNLNASGLRISHVHVDSTLATMMAEGYLSMARLGPILLGLDPLDRTSYSLDLRAVLAWKTGVIQTRVLPSGEQVATVAVGYADGLRAGPDNDHPVEVLAKGQRVAVVGEVAANRSMIYMSNLANVQIGDEVVLIGRQGRDEIRAAEMALCLGVTPLEALCSISDSVPRIVV